MKISQLRYTNSGDWKTIQSNASSDATTLVLVFGSGNHISNESLIAKIRNDFPKAILIGCSTSGEIMESEVSDDTLIVTAIEFEHTRVVHASVSINQKMDSGIAGEQLLQQLPLSGLKHVFVLSDGLNVNGSELVQAFNRVLPQHIKVTGGLAGDGADFKNTYVLDNGVKAEENKVSAIGFYGDRIEISYGSLGGWDSFGIERLVSKSQKNVLYELDGQPALALYKSFLGEHASQLPSSGLLFPLQLRFDPNEEPVVRTILAVDEENQSLTFAGNIPQNSYVRLMKANFDHLIEGAVGAARKTISGMSQSNPDLAILISCVGRKLVLKQLIDEEVEGARGILGQQTTFCGFYSYGEISPFSKDARCDLHNQTMTITTFKELE